MIKERSVFEVHTCIEGITPLSLLDKAVHLVHGVHGSFCSITVCGKAFSYFCSKRIDVFRTGGELKDGVNYQLVSTSEHIFWTG